MYKLIAVLVLVTLLGCNMSDDSEELPGGHTYNSEGSCYKMILINLKDGPDIESCVSEYKYDADFITVSQVDSTECIQIGLKNARNKKFYIINVQKELLLGQYNKDKFKQKFDELQIDEDLYIK